MPDPIQVRWTEPAAQDLKKIHLYIQKDSPSAAVTVARALFDEANSLGIMPGRGRLGKAPGTRELIVTRLPYIIIYRVTPEAIQILRIYHGARQGPPKL